MAPPASDDVSTPLSALKINTTSFAKNASKTDPVDSWEDDAASSPDTPTASSSNPLSPSTTTATGSMAPPPTPASPTTHSTFPSIDHPCANIPSTSSSAESSRPSKAWNPDQRPDKTMSTAARLIAGDLGLKAKKRTPDEVAYDRAMREKHIRLREEEKRAEAERERKAREAKAAIWED